uniref:Decapping nuclease n=1 Tax=Panagrolaimus superbus TaxID=310955 RepID=A0A914XYZ3_9BILA
MNYVVSKGFIPRSTAVNYCGVCVEVKSQEKIIFGSFKDIYGVYNLLQPNGHQSPVRTDRRQRFTKLKLTINKLLPMVKKMKGVEWYLCVEKDGILTVKHNSMIYPTDYLIAEMKQPRDATSEFNLIKSSLITAKHCDL